MRKSYRNNRPQGPVGAAHAAGKAAAASRDFVAALEHYRAALDGGGVTRAELLTDVLALGPQGKDELRSRRDTIEASIGGESRFSIDQWQALNLALREPDRDLKFVNAAVKAGIKPTDLPMFESVIYRLMKKGDFRRTLVYIEPLAQFLHEICQPADFNSNTTLDQHQLFCLVRTVVGSVVVAVQSKRLDLARMLIFDVLYLHPHAFTYCALRELCAERPFTGFRVVTDLDKRGKETVLTALEDAQKQLTPRALAEIVLTDCLAEIDPEHLVKGGAPRDEYCHEASSLAEALQRETTIEQIRHLLEKRFGGENTYGNPADLTTWATRLYCAVEVFLPQLLDR